MEMKDYSFCFKLSWLGCLFKSKAACVGIRTTVPTPLSSNAKSLNGSWAMATLTTPCRLKSSTTFEKQSATWKKALSKKQCPQPQEKKQNYLIRRSLWNTLAFKKKSLDVSLRNLLTSIASIRVYSPNILWLVNCSFHCLNEVYDTNYDLESHFLISVLKMLAIKVPMLC